MSIIIKPQKLPTHAGVYIFSRGKLTLYIGKAANLKKRLASYVTQLEQVLTRQGKNVGGKAHELLKEATKLEWIESVSEVEALIKEAELIKKYHPKYNYLMRDDKNYFYVGVTREKFPRIFVTHHVYQNQELRVKSFNKLKFDLGGSNAKIKYIGPFTSGIALKTTLKLLRRVFPYCICRRPHKRLCLSAQIGRCFGFCCQQNYPTSKRPLASWIVLYRENIKNVVAVLDGKKKKLLSQLKKDMHRAVKKQEFEMAVKFRNQIFGIENVFTHRPVLKSALESMSHRYFSWQKTERNIQYILHTTKSIVRAEGYDVSNISGTAAVGAMVVFTRGRPEKSEYRKFGIKTVTGVNDIKMLSEVIRRRLTHIEWMIPDLMVIDGGRAQLGAALQELKIRSLESKISITALAKREEELYTINSRAPIPLKTLPPDTALFFQHIRDEAHRFAKKYHLKKREIFYRKN